MRLDQEAINSLNEEQREAVLYGDGPLLVIAGAGSGKTRVLTMRIAHLVLDRGIAPDRILAITFTRKASSEMKERLEDLLGEQAKNLWTATFHSALVKMLRPYSEQMGLKSNWTIIDDDDSRTTVKNCTEDVGYDPKEISVGGTVATISNWKNRMISPDKAFKISDDDYDVIRARIYAAYQETLLESNAVDYDDILYKAVELLQNHPNVLKKFQNRFDYLFVDEYQDTNVVQHELVRLIGARHQNVCVVGDSDQCLTPDTMIQTLDGEKRADQIRIGDSVLGSGGLSSMQLATVSHVKEGNWTGRLYSIVAGGRVLKGTPHHILLADVKTVKDNKWIVYLVQSAGQGYWITLTEGMVKSVPRAHTSQDYPYKLWVLHICESQAEASHFESVYAAQYGIPTAHFNSIGYEEMPKTNYLLARSCEQANNISAAKNLMNELGLHPDFPCLRAQNESNGHSVTLTMFSSGCSSNGGSSHNIRWDGVNSDYAKLVKDTRFNVSLNESSYSDGRVEATISSYTKAVEFTQAIAEVDELEINRQAQIDGDIYLFTPLSHLRVGMTVLVKQDNQLRRMAVERVFVEEYSGPVYDFEVDEIHTYLANGVLVHNSIYGFRAAEIKNILEFDKVFPDTKTIKLERNYRSTRTILDAANAVISNNKDRSDKNLWTETESGAEIVVHALPDNNEECRWIAQQIVRQLNQGRKGGDIAVLCRMKTIAEDIEKALIGREVPCKLVGGLGFLQRAVIKDALCFLRLVVNPDDQPAFRRVINTPRRQIGDSSIKKIRKWARVNGIPLSEAMTKGDILDIPPAAQRGLSNFIEILGSARDMTEENFSAGDILTHLLQKFHYFEHVSALGGDVAPRKLSDLDSLINIAKNYKSAQDFLEEITLMTDEQDETDDSRKVVIMTMHGSKGLEFDVVFSPAWEDGIFPSHRDNTEEEREEERRLAYVVITRARQQLYLTRARNRLLWGKTSQNKPSPFLSELPPELLAPPL